MSEYIVREATLNDVDFIVKAIIEAEKSGSEILSYSTVFNISEELLKKLFRRILLEEIDGCEFSITSYLVVEIGNKVVGTIGAWVEHRETPSSFIKSNLLSYFLPESSILYASREARITSELFIDHVDGALSLVVVYISPEHRGHNLFELLTNEHIKRNEGIQELSVQVMANNIYAIRSYERYGFKECFTKKSENEKIARFLPFNEKILMRKQLKSN
ncbi:MAG: GNAT family N-acetyltransferase [Bacteroidales bacterium]|jgi:ribosomal protein S18 acetylase RimI-like enzyme